MLAQMLMVIKGCCLCKSFSRVGWRPWWLCKHMRVRSWIMLYQRTWWEYLYADLKEQEGTEESLLEMSSTCRMAGWGIAGWLRGGMQDGWNGAGKHHTQLCMLWVD